MTESNALAGALGSIIGYLGGEVAESIVFERLLWPQRFYNKMSMRNFVEMVFFMPMGGPLHKAALQSLDVMQQKGLYYGAAHGHMLGTAFYQNKKLTYKIHGYDGPDNDNEIRNGLWATVLQKCRDFSSLRTIPMDKGDSEARAGKPPLVRRTTQAVLHLQLSRPRNQMEIESVSLFSENGVSVKIVFAVIASELTAIGCAIAIAWHERCFWFAAYFCIPLLLKLISLVTTVRREPSVPKDSQPGNNYGVDEDPTAIFEISDYDHGFPVVEGPEKLVRQFFKHWGHPIRKNNRDRFRELAGITLIFIFVLYFPLGLLSMLWVNQPVQILWLSYQLYLIVAMHITRIRGSAGIGRLEEGIARELADKKRIALKGSNGEVVMAELVAYPVDRILHGRAKVQEIVDGHVKTGLKHRDSSSSETTLLPDSDENEKSPYKEKL